MDESDIIKPYAEKKEHLSLVRDGSKNVIEKGYTTINFSMASPKTKHPIPLYYHIYSSREEHFQNQNFEIVKGFDAFHSFLGEKNATFVMFRGYDNNAMFQYVQDIGHFFVTRLIDTRYLIHRNQRIKVPDLAKRRKGKINFETEIQGKIYNLKVSHIKVELPIPKDTPLNMVVGYGAKPMKLLTNHAIKGKEDVPRILKGYITRWRIEELFRVQKEEFKLEKNTCHTQVVLARARSSSALAKIKFYLYRFIRRVSKILSFDTLGIKHFHRIEQRSSQLSLC